MYIIMFFFLLLLPFNSFSAEIGNEVLDDKVILKVENYLNNITSLVASFKQEDQKKNIALGKFQLKKPGKFRWEYPDSLLICDAKKLVYYDKQLDETTYASPDDVGPFFLSKNKINLKRDFEVISAYKLGNKINISLKQKVHSEYNILNLVFIDSPISLLSVKTMDGEDNKTKITFKNLKLNVNLNNSLFVFKDPKFVKDVWERR